MLAGRKSHENAGQVTNKKVTQAREQDGPMMKTKWTRTNKYGHHGQDKREGQNDKMDKPTGWPIGATPHLPGEPLGLHVVPRARPALVTDGWVRTGGQQVLWPSSWHGREIRHTWSKGVQGTSERIR